MNCPRCHRAGKFLVLETRTHDGAVYRRRACGGCGKSFVTHEIAEPGMKMPDAVSNSFKRRGETPAAEAPASIRGDGAHLQGLLS